MVRPKGLEPLRAFAHQLLRLARLPIPPRPHVAILAASPSYFHAAAHRSPPAAKFKSACRPPVGLLGFASDSNPGPTRRPFMPHCTKCGANIADNAGFCPSCGAAQAAGSSASAAPLATSTGMDENVAGALCYLLGWVTGLIFYFIDKRPFVRFHAAQSIVVFGGLHILSIILGMFFGFSILTHGAGGFSLGFGLMSIINLLTFVLWVFLMIKAFQHEKFRVPVAADLADQIFKP